MREPSADPAFEGFQIHEDRLSESTTVLAVRGDADLHSAPELRRRLRAAIEGGAGQVVVDLSGASFVDSTSLGVLLGAKKLLREQDGEIRLVVSRPEVRRVLEITLLDRIFPLYDTREEALSALAGGAA